MGKNIETEHSICIKNASFYVRDIFGRPCSIYAWKRRSELYGLMPSLSIKNHNRRGTIRSLRWETFSRMLAESWLGLDLRTIQVLLPFFHLQSGHPDSDRKFRIYGDPSNIERRKEAECYSLYPYSGILAEAVDHPGVLDGQRLCGTMWSSYMLPADILLLLNLAASISLSDPEQLGIKRKTCKTIPASLVRQRLKLDIIPLVWQRWLSGSRIELSEVHCPVLTAFSHRSPFFLASYYHRALSLPHPIEKELSKAEFIIALVT